MPSGKVERFLKQNQFHCQQIQRSTFKNFNPSTTNSCLLDAYLQSKRPVYMRIIVTRPTSQ